MTRARLVSAAATAAALLIAWAVWRASPQIVAFAGLQRYDLLGRVLVVFAALGLAEAMIGLFAARLFPAEQGQAKDPANDQ